MHEKTVHARLEQFGHPGITNMVRPGQVWHFYPLGSILSPLVRRMVLVQLAR